MVSVEQLIDLRRVYGAVISSQSEAMRLALNRLNGCLTRTDPSDAILDGTIGLELLLGDDQNQSLAYKLRLRAAALALLKDDAAYPPIEVASKVKRLYEARSAIVHGRRKKRSKKASEPTDTTNAKERLLAADLLRFVLDVLVMNPEYQDNPAKIDEGLLLRGDVLVIYFARKNYLWLVGHQHKVAEAVCIGTLTFDRERKQLVKTYREGLSLTAPTEVLDLSDPTSTPTATCDTLSDC